MLPLAWTDRGSVAAVTPLTYEVLVELAVEVEIFKGRCYGVL
jgi:hypothetical protein